MNKDPPMAQIHIIRLNKIGFAEIPLKSVKLAWLPMQKSPKISKTLLANSKLVITPAGSEIKNCIHKAAIKKTINKGTLMPFFESGLLNISPVINTRGISHKVLPSFKVAAVFTASGSNASAAPMTELVS